ncbi:MAG: DUF2703 domain-containing protein [candidate division KSB1 bacterium]|jgi:glutaredoxin|nr:DUF2703 domain-containing protein [candidate division KSB1 bacterium]
MTKIEVQYFEGCPHAEPAIRLCERYRDEHTEVTLILTRVESDEEAAKVGFRGSPTILINGKDLFGDPVPDEPHLACRFYPSGLPSYEAFIEMIKFL